jgi:hypothetical protein
MESMNHAALIAGLAGQPTVAVAVALNLRTVARLPSLRSHNFLTGSARVALPRGAVLNGRANAFAALRAFASPLKIWSTCS